MKRKIKPIELLSDQAITKKTEDRFNRSMFVQSVADIIRSQSVKVNPDNIVAFKDVEENMIIGLYGAWGFGKSSILNLLKEDLESQQQQCVFFNPWMYSDEDQLLASLFNTITTYSGLNDDGQKKLIKVLKRYHLLVSAVSARAGQVVDGLVSAIDNSEETNAFYCKQKIDEILTGMAHPLVIFIDDVDRLSKDEIHILFKTLRLIASFKHVIYVIACDYEMVSKSIKENYVDGNIEDGRSFIDKIIQIPIRIPEINHRKLSVFASDYIKLTVDIDVSENNLFNQVVQAFFRTPRDIKRFVNGFRFTQNYIGSSVLPIDLIFLELIRIKIHGLFEIIRIYYISLISLDSKEYYKKEVRKFLLQNKPHFLRENGTLETQKTECFMYDKILREVFSLSYFTELQFILNGRAMGYSDYIQDDSITGLKSLKNPKVIIDYFEKSDQMNEN